MPNPIPQPASTAKPAVREFQGFPIPAMYPVELTYPKTGNTTLVHDDQHFCHFIKFGWRPAKPKE